MTRLVSMLTAILLILPLRAAAEQPAEVAPEGRAAIKIGYVGSLSGFAASYGQAVLSGVQLAALELEAVGQPVQLIVEDDLSEMKNTVTAARKLLDVDGVQALIAGTWWAITLPPIMKAHPRIPLLSCETSFNRDTIAADNYFLMLGHLRDWAIAFEPLVQEQGLARGAALHFTSGFGQTLADGMRELFSMPGRTFAADLAYTTVDAADAPALLLRLKTVAPEALYIDGQPASLASMLKKAHELRLNFTIFTNDIARDAYEQKLLSPALTEKLYFTQRARLSRKFDSSFQKHFGRPARLESDLGYYTMLMLKRSIKEANPVEALKSSPAVIDGLTLGFDERNVLKGITQEIWGFKNGQPELLSLPATAGND